MPITNHPHALQELIDNLGADGHTLHIDRSRQVYTNRDVNLAEIDSIGFDMDYTLALYRQEAMDGLATTLTLERLVAHRGYPESIFNLTWDPAFAIRGLLIDKLHGNILKVDAGRHVVKAFHGYRPVENLGNYTYHREAIRIDPARYHLIDTLFGLPEVGLYAALVDHFEQRGQTLTSWAQLFDDIRFCIDLAHRDGSLKAAVMADLERYVVRDGRLADTLHKFRSAGKKLFLLTNSEYTYTRAVMSYLLDGVHYPSWRQYFDLIITLASKPRFFTDTQPFLALDDEGNPTGALLPGTPLRRGAIYQGGNLRHLEDSGNIGLGNRVLYIGDHIYGDILKSKKTCLWKTCMVVQEMAVELLASDSIRDDLGRLRALEAEHNRLSEELAYASHLHHHLEQLGKRIEDLDAETRAELRGSLRTLHRTVQDTRAARQDVVTQLVTLDRELEGRFNPYWGPIFLARNEQSIFGSQVSLFADLYISSVSNFLAYSPLQYLRASRPLMPHEV